METKEIKIQVPEGYEVDKEKSTFEKIIFKKKSQTVITPPKTWYEYCCQCKLNKKVGYYIGTDCTIEEIDWEDFIEDSSDKKFTSYWRDMLPTEGHVKKFIAYMQLISLREAWVGEWVPDRKSVSIISTTDDKIILWQDPEFVLRPTLSFPNSAMAAEFLNCFKGLLIEAKGLY